MRRRSRVLARALTCASIVLVAASCQADGDDNADGTPIEEPSSVTQATNEPADEPADEPIDSTSGDDTTTTSADEPDPTTTLVLATTPPEKTSVPATSAPPGEPATETVYEVGMVDRGLAPFVALATADLAERLDIEPESIEVLTAVLVVWPDASLGCPEPDLMYAQVLTDGSVIELGVDGLVYRYHSGGDQPPFPCDRPLDPAPEPSALPSS
jgi:hypothetical protein